MTKVSQAFAIVLVVCAAITLTAVLYLHHALRNPDRFIPQITASFEKSTGKQLEIKHLEVHLFPPLTVRAYGVEIKNPKPFPGGDLLNIPSLDAAINVGSLIGGRVRIRSLVLYSPTANVISDPDGLWNFQNPGQQNQYGSEAVRFSMRSISKLQIHNGVFLGSVLIEPNDKPGPVLLELRNISTGIQEVNFDQFENSPDSAQVIGKLTAERARFGAVHMRDLDSELEITPTQMTFKNLHAKTYRGNANGNFSFNYAGKATKFETNLKVSGVGMDYLLREFESGSPRISGMMQAQLSLGGNIVHTTNPLEDLSGGGTFAVHKGQFPGIAKGKKMAEMKRFRNSSAAALPVSAFSSFAGDMELKNRHIYSRHIAIDFYGIDVEGAGNLNEMNGGMDYAGNAVIQKKQGFFTSMYARMFKGADEKNGRLVFPIRVSGTAQQPKFSVAD